MADEVETRRTEFSHHAIQIEHVVRKIVISAGANPAAVAVAAAVGCDDPTHSVESLFQGRDQSPPAVREIEVAVDQQDRLAVGLAPFEIMNRQALRIDKLFAGLRHRTTGDRSELRRSRSFRRTMQMPG